MTVEYLLLLITVFGIGMRFFTSAPMDAFRESGPKLGARIEKNIQTGGEFKENGQVNQWTEGR